MGLKERLIEEFVKERGWFIPALHERYIKRELDKHRESKV